MKLSEAREHYYAHSGSASAVARQIAFAGIAVVWVFNRAERDDPINLSQPLVLALILCVLSLLLDLLQYASSALVWGYFSRSREKQHQQRLDPTFASVDDPELLVPAWFNWPGLTCFWCKLAALAVGYAVLLDHLRTFV